MQKLPRHIGIIMDGNGRWAKMRQRHRTFGHLRGARVARQTVSTCSRLGVKHLTLFAFSTENWLRPKEEVNLLMRILERYLIKEQVVLMEQNIRFTTLGDLSRLPTALRQLLQRTVQNTAKNTGMNLIFAVSYGARAEIASTAKALCQRVLDGDLSVDEVDEAIFDSHLSSYPAPDVDLVIRTSGECRLSNFMLWQAAYAELYFTEVLWPDFSEQHLMKALQWFSHRDRRFGQVQSHELTLD